MAARNENLTFNFTKMKIIIAARRLTQAARVYEKIIPSISKAKTIITKILKNPLIFGSEKINPAITGTKNARIAPYEV